MLDILPKTPSAAAQAAMGESEGMGESRRGDDDGAAAHDGVVILFYVYAEVGSEAAALAERQRALCERLGLVGKVRVATEGLNVTVSGAGAATEAYVEATAEDPALRGALDPRRVHRSMGPGNAFAETGLKVKVCEEIIPMGVAPQALTAVEGGRHIDPSELHALIEGGVPCDMVLVDLRNFYETRVGFFEGAWRPDIRKFKQWPDYARDHVDVFAGKRVVAYCTGGVRCERGTAVLQKLGVCKDVMQVRGGIHGYLQWASDARVQSLFRGTMFVFDDRVAVRSRPTTSGARTGVVGGAGGGDIVGRCFHCDAPWEDYSLCTSAHCRILVLACPACRNRGIAYCCDFCNSSAMASASEATSNDGEGTVAGGTGRRRRPREQCSCTDLRAKGGNK